MTSVTSMHLEQTMSYEPQPLSFVAYRNNKDRYGYIATWCVWDEESKRGPEMVQAADEATFVSKGLSSTLHSDVVVLGLNYGMSAKWATEHGEIERAAERLKQIAAGEKFANMYRAMRPYYAPVFRDTALWGAYATDFFKFTRGQEAMDQPAGIPSKDGSGIPDFYFTPDGIDLQVQGLRAELATVDAPGDLTFVFVSSRLMDFAAPALRQAFPDCRIAEIYHYKYPNARILREMLPDQVAVAHRIATGLQSG